VEFGDFLQLAERPAGSLSQTQNKQQQLATLRISAQSPGGLSLSPTFLTVLVHLRFKKGDVGAWAHVIPGAYYHAMTGMGKHSHSLLQY
jgi:hypothetical protein